MELSTPRSKLLIFNTPRRTLINNININHPHNNSTQPEPKADHRIHNPLELPSLREMAHILLHGTLHVTVYEVDKLHSGGGGPKIFRKVLLSPFFTIQ
ncbi:hypothetical protein CMV_030586 [Castanea mollissima]|uniref:Uncharacterized protein n=1 Tax=Castanea mollissima TaxID=60419 RepID=A0A8J4Q5W6_9ROSI|nr:hypothetical protein CMV_030586 [Castanea mollissima]